MDAFFATKKFGKSYRGNICFQIFSTDKGFIYVITMKSKSEVLQAVKLFAKKIGSPEAMICDVSGDQTSNTLNIFCSKISATLRFLEEVTP